jgi:regulator of sirC expression with transglutaminase-like and TPR domain
MTPALDVLQALVDEKGDDLPLDRGAALLAAHEQPGVDPRAVLDALDELAAGVRIAPETEPIEAVARLHHRLFQELGFQGDDEEYDHPRNSRIDLAIQRRRGLPITLCVIYVEVARRKGLAVDPIGFPSHFLVSPRCEPRFFVDPFAAGRIVREDDLLERLEDMGLGHEANRWLAPVSARQVLVRMSHNLLGAYQRRGDRAGIERARLRLRVLAS